MSGNGADLGQGVAMLGNVLTAQEAVRVELHESRIEARRDSAAARRDLATLRQTVAEYHASVLGHGVLISELDERLRRVEERLGLSPAAE